MKKNRGYYRGFLLLTLLVLGMSHRALAQSPAPVSRLQTGINLYGEGKWREAVIELRRAQAEAHTKEQHAEALYWISLSEMSAGEYEGAVKDLEALEETGAVTRRMEEVPYHKGRAFYYLGRFDEAIVLLKNYNDSLPGIGENASRKSAALYWIGESLFSLGQLDNAAGIFILLTEQYPRSAKYEAATYRIALINQKKIEAELLSLLKWSHEESLKTMEEYQRREHAYDQALIAYQKRIADMLKDTRLSDLENENAQFKRELAFAQERIQGLERDLQLALAGFGPEGPRDKKARLEAMREQASSLINEISSAGRAGR
jgi:tetratricopeptide (TPR) repeat protein